MAPEPKSYQLAENNIIVRFDEKRGETEAREVLAIAIKARQQLMEKYYLPSAAHVEIRLTGTTAEFCQRTGRPWWLASIYRDRTIYLQPVRVLRERGILATTLRHELMHQLVDERTKGNGPSWLNEALAIYNSGEIARLKSPSASKNFAKTEELTFDELERRLQTAKSKDEFDHLYFQLYYLGRFLETNFQLGQITALLLRLSENNSLSLACLDAFGVSAQEFEQSWRKYWAKIAK